MKCVLLLAFAVTVSLATVGVDVSSLYPATSWECLKNNGYEFAIIRCYRSIGDVDQHCLQSVANAWAGGMKHVDIYMFPCPKCGDARGQVTTLKKYVTGLNYGKMWIDVEGTKYWLGDHEKNREFFKELESAARSIFGSNFGGLYSSIRQWEPIFGQWTAYSHVPLWFSQWDKNASWSGWKPFGGWTKPVMKQFQGDTSLCSMSIDKDFY